MPNAWPFHCPAPRVQFLQDGTAEAVEVTWWKERSSDLNKLAPLHRAVFTYLTWDPPNDRGRLSPYGGTLIGDELASLSDPNRCDGTCTVLTDGTLSAMSTMYNSADNSIAAADFGPCVANTVPDGDPRLPNVTDPWFEPGTLW